VESDHGNILGRQFCESRFSAEPVTGASRRSRGSPVVIDLSPGATSYRDSPRRLDAVVARHSDPALDAMNNLALTFSSSSLAPSGSQLHRSSGRFRPALRNRGLSVPGLVLSRNFLGSAVITSARTAPIHWLYARFRIIWG